MSYGKTIAEYSTQFINKLKFQKSALRPVAMLERYYFSKLLRSFLDCEVTVTALNSPTNGEVCSVLMAHHINDDDPILIASCDQVLMMDIGAH